MDTTEFVLILLVVTIVAFVLLREFFCWYFKINQRSEQNEKIIKLLAKQIELKKIQMGIIKTAASEDDRDFWKDEPKQPTGINKLMGELESEGKLYETN